MVHLARFLPSLTILVIALISVMPWGHGDSLRFLVPAASFMAIHFWDYRHPNLVVSPFIALLGLGIDVLTSGPLGFWPLVFLSGHAATRIVLRFLQSPNGFTQWLSFLVSASVMSVVAWLAASAYFVQPADWYPMLVSVVGQGFAYPFVARALAPAARLVDGPRVLTLERRG